MNITAKIQELENELREQYRIKWDAHNRIKEINTQTKKLKTLAKHAEEVLESKVEENGQGELTGV